MKKVTLSGTKRSASGTSAAQQIRRAGQVPCVLYGGTAPLHFSIERKAVEKVIYTPETYRIELDVDGQKTMALLKETQFDPVKDHPIHVDFLEMHEAKEVVVSLHVRLNGQPAGVRAGGKLSQPFRKLRVKGLPDALPEHLDVDVAPLALGESIRIRDLAFQGLSILERATDVVAAVKMAKKEEVAAVATPTAAATASTTAAAAAPAADAKKVEAKPAAGKK
jgi:large subunit ribosomal protein L25